MSRGTYPHKRGWRALTATRLAVLVFIYRHHQQHQELPSSNTIVKAGVSKNRGKVVRDMQALETLGYLYRAPGISEWSDGFMTSLGGHAALMAIPEVESANPPRRKHREQRTMPDWVLKDGRSVNAHRVRIAGRQDRVLLPGRNNIKLGDSVTKGRWRGLPIYSLTLEERATCPRSCLQWKTCYGNNMPFAVRFEQGEDLERAITRDLWRLGRTKPQGILVRLHMLGDFYSLDYVRFWYQMLYAHPKLRIFGFTAWLPETQIGAAVHTILNGAFPDRCWIRFSGGHGSMSAKVVRKASAEAGVIMCPEQTGRVPDCGACGLCWTASKQIAFLLH